MGWFKNITVFVRIYTKEDGELNEFCNLYQIDRWMRLIIDI